MKKTYPGSCHCGAVQFEADIDLSRGTYKCNCSICTMNRFWPAVIPDSDFRLLQGESELTEYLFNSRLNRHVFCRHCGVRGFGIGHSPDGPMIGVNVMCLQGLDLQELLASPITYTDGRHNRWDRVPDEVRHL